MTPFTANRASVHPEIVPGVFIGPWQVLARWDWGSFGAVFRVGRAGHPRAGSFALKLALRPEDPRFVREAEMLQRVANSSVPRFEDRGWWTGPDDQIYPYVVMEWVEGTPLYRWAREQPRTSSQVLQVLAQLARVLAEVHAAGGLHRDVKGDNVLVTSGGRAVLLDWGCCTYPEAKALTDTALPPGTSSYRAPEAIRWGWEHRLSGTCYRAGPPDDIYALGVTGYRLCTGSYPPQPSEGSGPPRRLQPPRKLATVSVGLERLLLAALSQERHSRPSALPLAIELLAAAGEKDAARPIVPKQAAAPTEHARRPGPASEVVMPRWLAIAGSALVVGLLAVVVLMLPHLSPPAPSYSSVEEVRHGPSPEAPDAGVADEALSTVQKFPRDVVPYVAVGEKMPTKPFPGQKKPPCIPRFEREVLGVCWSVLKAEPPCEKAGFDHKGECLRAVFEGLRQPTSEEP